MPRDLISLYLLAAADEKTNTSGRGQKGRDEHNKCGGGECGSGKGAVVAHRLNITFRTVYGL